MFLRSITAFGIVARAAGPEATRGGSRLAADVSDGLLVSLYLAIMSFMAWIVASPYDIHGEGARLVASDVRRYVLRLLEERTHGARNPAPPFEKVLRDVEDKMDEVLAEGPLSHPLHLDKDFARASVLACIHHMRTEFGGFGGNADFTPPRQTPFLHLISSLFSTPFRFGARLGRPCRPEPNPTEGSTITLLNVAQPPQQDRPESRPPNRQPSIHSAGQRDEAPPPAPMRDAPAPRPPAADRFPPSRPRPRLRDPEERDADRPLTTRPGLRNSTPAAMPPAPRQYYPPPPQGAGLGGTTPVPTAGGAAGRQDGQDDDRGPLVGLAATAGTAVATRRVGGYLIPVAQRVSTEVPDVV